MTRVGNNQFEFSQHNTLFEVDLNTNMALCAYDNQLASAGILVFDPSSMDKDFCHSFHSFLVQFLKTLKNRGCQRKHLTLKAGFGPDFSYTEPNESLQGIHLVQKWLARYGLKLESHKVGQKLRFSSHSGVVETLRGPSQQTRKLTRVLIIDDSPSIHKILKKIIDSDEELEVIGTVHNPLEAEEFLKHETPDLITLDIKMPHMTGTEYLEQKLAHRKIPVVLITALCSEESDLVLRALELGATDYIQKPNLQDMESMAGTICQTLKHAAKTRPQLLSSRLLINSKKQSKAAFSESGCKNGLILIGASTGGTVAIKELLMGLPKQIPPILIVQHIPPQFSRSFAERLDEACPFCVKEAKDRDPIVPNQVLIAPGGLHLGVSQPTRRELIARLYDQDPVNRHKPSVDFLFHSALDVHGFHMAAALLTGMGIDGAQGLLSLKNAGVSTFAQDEKSSVVFGMPKAAIALGAADKVVGLSSLAKNLVEWSLNITAHKTARVNSLQ